MYDHNPAVSDSSPKITVIVTVHNAEQYLRECLDSVIMQTFTDIEILCMDGGSTDNSPQILREYEEKDDRIRIINDPDTSYGHKINEGIRLASGEYISVLESDDMYFPDMLEHLYAVARQYHPDFVNADYLEFWEINGKRHEILVKMYPESDYNCLLESGKHLEDMRQILRYWTGVFKKDFLEKKEIRMNESPGASFQDMSFRFLTSALAETSYHLDIPVYRYRTDNPFSSVSDPGKAAVIADEFDFLKKELERREITAPHLWRHFYTWKYNDFCGNLARFSQENRKVLLQRCCQELEKDRMFLEQNNGKEYSESIKLLLENTPDDFQKEIEVRFQNLQKLQCHKEELFRRLNGHTAVIFGCGAFGRRALDSLGSSKEQIGCLTDNQQKLWNTRLEGHKILSPEDAVEQYPEAFYIVANKANADDMVQQLKSMGIRETMIYIY